MVEALYADFIISVGQKNKASATFGFMDKVTQPKLYTIESLLGIGKESFPMAEKSASTIISRNQMAIRLCVAHL